MHRHRRFALPWEPTSCGALLGRRRLPPTATQSPGRQQRKEHHCRMKFGKRLAAEAARHYGEQYFDYKTIKKSIKDDILEKDAQGTHFQRMLVAELQKVSQFYSQKAAQLEQTFQHCSDGKHAGELSELRGDIQELIKFVALNYLAVVKAIKKRNRHLQENFGMAANTSLHALDLLIGEVFFTSPRLAALATQAEVLSQDLQSCKAQHGSQAHQALLEEYTCPVCLDTLHNPVVLTCAHRFCWGCLVAHCTASREAGLPLGKAKPTTGAAGPVTSYRVLEQIACNQEPEAPCFYPCPVCRKPQILDIDTLQVDTYLEAFIDNLKAISAVSVSTQQQQQAAETQVAPAPGSKQQPAEQQVAEPMVQEQPAMAVPAPAPVQAVQPWGIIPPQEPQHQGKLCVLLDLDGTLVSSFTPKRAPRLPPYVRTHVVGVGSKLNPQGVFVVERPGLTSFLEQLAAFAEVIVFTAGLEDYASPIIDAIDPQNRFFAARIYREGTLRTEYYQCVKDMARLNRDLKRTVLVDDTPLAFLHQPDNGIPILGFRGDPDDRLLLEAVLPMLQTIATEADVTPLLHRRFDMGTWFKKHGFPVDQIVQQALASAAAEREQHRKEALQQHNKSVAVPGQPAAPVGQPTCLQPRIMPAHPPTKPMLLLADFDKTILDCDAGERVVEQLAPELLPMLVGIESPANFIPITNSLLGEMTRRGVSRDQLLTTLQALGATEVPQAAVRLLTDARAQNVDVKLLSDCNSVFISHILAGARVANMVSEVITNPASFERAVEDRPGVSAARATHKLVIKPWHGSGARPSHKCPMCPENLCKGKEIRLLQQAGTYKRVVYLGDGANDICPALCLGPGDVVLARAGYPLARYIQRGEAGEEGVFRLQAAHKSWRTHEELHALVRVLLQGI